MNYWTQKSIELANQYNYLDQLFSVYPLLPDNFREIDKEKWKQVEIDFEKKNNIELLNSLLDFDLFPIKDSYIAYLKKDRSALQRNPQTVNRIAGRLYEMGLAKIFEKCSEPKETNRQIGPLFRRWVYSGALGLSPISEDKFLNTKDNAILEASDEGMKNFAKNHLSYTRDKGLDFIARFNGKYVIGEAKFLTDFGGHQNAQFEDAISTLNSSSNAISIAILDGVVYMESKNKMHLSIKNSNNNILSALLLRDFLYQI